MRKRWFVLVFLVIVAVITIYVTFFYYPNCNDMACWDSKLRDCSKAHFVNNPVDATWEYWILGKETVNEERRCSVRVKVVEIKRGLKKTESLTGKEMVCYLPLGIVTAPEGNPNLCVGRLKEEMQGLIIQKLHEYIVQNLGEISEDIEIGEVDDLLPDLVLEEENNTNSSV